MIGDGGAPLPLRRLFKRACAGGVVDPFDVLRAERSIGSGYFESFEENGIHIEADDANERPVHPFSEEESDGWWRAAAARLPGFSNFSFRIHGSDVPGPSGPLPFLPGAAARFAAGMRAHLDSEGAEWSEASFSIHIPDPDDPSSTRVRASARRPHTGRLSLALDAGRIGADAAVFAAWIGPWLAGCSKARIGLQIEANASHHELLEARMLLEIPFHEAAGPGAAP